MAFLMTQDTSRSWLSAYPGEPFLELGCHSHGRKGGVPHRANVLYS